MDYISEESFLEKSMYLWEKDFLKDLFEWFSEIEKSDIQESKERNFIEMKLEFEQAYRELMKNIKELPLIMNCRVKGDNTSNFGGKQCALFVKSIRKSAEKYIKNSSLSKEDGIKAFVSKIRDKARKNEQYAWDFEKNSKQEYTTLGVDNSLKIFQRSGYNI